LHRTPLHAFRVEDLRLMIGQRQCLPYLLPLALEHLREAPLVAGDLFPGDLLCAVLRIDPAFWRDYPEWRRQVEAIVRGIEPLPTELVAFAAAFLNQRR
jgi:hypothetical protein